MRSAPPPSSPASPRNRLASAAAALLARQIEKRFGGYMHAVVAPDPRLPERAPVARRVAVVGSGVAGITAAATLAERGYEVSLLERNGYLGGKIGGWTERIDGELLPVEHGFHAFFRNYYNLRALLGRAGLGPDAFAQIDDYAILRRDGRALGFRGVRTEPYLNLVSLGLAGIYPARDLALNPRMHRLDPFLRYDRDATFAAWDAVSFAQFAREADLPPDLMLLFNTFARAFFADAERMSVAELIKSFHFYYLSHDRGLLYDYVAGDYASTLLAPLRTYLERLGVQVRTGVEVDRIERRGARLAVGDATYDAVVLATDVVGARAILGRSPAIGAEAPGFAAQIERLRPSQRYAVLRLWLDRDVTTAVPVFAITDRLTALDSVTLVHRIDPAARAWAAARGGPRGAVLELHCYAVPDALAPDAAVRAALVTELEHFFPELRGARVVHEHLQVRADFAAFHTGMWRDRPTHATPVAGLYLAGDWVKLPYPAMLMEAACMAGLLCANELFARDGLRAAPVYSVPPRGLLAR